jgi:hypothetical protein
VAATGGPTARISQSLFIFLMQALYKYYWLFPSYQE